MHVFLSFLWLYWDMKSSLDLFLLSLNTTSYVCIFVFLKCMKYSPVKYRVQRGQIMLDIYGEPYALVFSNYKVQLMLLWLCQYIFYIR